MRSKQVEGAMACVKTNTYSFEHFHTLADYVSRLEGELARVQAENNTLRTDGGIWDKSVYKARAEKAEAALAEALRDLAECEKHENCYGPEPIRKIEANLASEKSKRLEAERVAGELRVAAEYAVKIFKFHIENNPHSIGQETAVRDLERALSQSPAPAKCQHLNRDRWEDDYCRDCKVHILPAPKPEAKECGECEAMRDTPHFSGSPRPRCPSCQEPKK